MLEKFSDLLPKRNLPVLGLDIGSNAVKVVELKKEKGGHSLHRLGISSLNEGMVREGTVVNVDSVSEKIREAVAASGTKLKNVVMAVTGTNVLSRFVDFPKMDKKELVEAIRWEAEKYIPLPPEECYIDADIVDKGDEAADSMKILLVAAPKELVDIHCEAVLRAGLEPKVIEPQGLAISRGLLPEGFEDTAVIVDIGASATKIVIYSKGVMIFQRNIPLGGSRITSILMNSMSLSYQEAENYKLRPNFLQNISNPDLKQDIILLLNDIRREIRRSIEYFLSRERHIQIKKFYLTGGASMLPEFVQSLSAEVGINVQLGNPFRERLSVSANIDPGFISVKGTMLSVAAGLAMREVSDRG